MANSKAENGVDPIIINPIGWVRNGIVENPAEGWGDVVSRIELRPELAEGLDGIEGFSHLMVLFWLDRVGPEYRTTLKIHPRGRKDLPEVGVFALHSQSRPNPIALTVVELMGKEAPASIVVRGLDAIDGTPVLDIKSYGPSQTRLAEDSIRVPEWARRLR